MQWETADNMFVTGEKSRANHGLRMLLRRVSPGFEYFQDEEVELVDEPGIRCIRLLKGRIGETAHEGNDKPESRPGFTASGSPCSFRLSLGDPDIPIRG